MACLPIGLAGPAHAVRVGNLPEEPLHIGVHINVHINAPFHDGHIIVNEMTLPTQSHTMALVKKEEDVSIHCDSVNST